MATDSNGKADSSNRVIAVAGIVATAVVGIAGAGATWLVSREDRNSQRALARDARVYDHRAAVYIDALTLFRSLDMRMHAGVVTGRFYVPTPPPKLELSVLAQMTRGSQRVRPRLLAYGSDDASRVYNEAARALINSGEDYFGDRRRQRLFKHDVGTFFAEYLRFGTIVHRELTGG